MERPTKRYLDWWQGNSSCLRGFTEKKKKGEE